MKTQIQILLVSFFLSISSFAQIMVISDIDDTLKVSNVLDWQDTAQNAALIHNHYTGMSELFNYLQQTAPSPVQFFYLSNAPRKVMGVLHDSFLNFNLFPQGPTYLRASIFDSNHKIRTINALIEQHRPALLILVGDNGEKDAHIYAAVKTAHPQLPMHTYIHLVYSAKSSTQKGSSVYPFQVGYATSVELAGDFRSKGLISEDAYIRFQQAIIPKILNERSDLMSGEVAFPAWMDCRDVNFPVVDSRNELLVQYDAKARKRCSFVRHR